MKTQVILLACLIMQSVSVWALDSELFPNAEFRVRYNYNKSDEGTTTDWNQRGLIGLKYRSGERYSAHFQLLNKSFWGVDTEEVASISGDRNNDNTLTLFEANGTWIVEDDVLIKMGRMPIEFSEGSLFSKNDYSNNPYTFDALNVQYDSDVAQVQFWMIQKLDVDSASGVGADPERNIYLISVDLKSLPKFLNKTNIHIVQDNSQQISSPTAMPSKHISRYGIHLDGGISGVFYKLTYNAESGDEELLQQTKVSAFMANLSLGYAYNGFWKPSVVVSYHTDSGDNSDSITDGRRERYDSYFYEQHKFSGRMEAFSWGNLTTSSLLLQLEPKEKQKYSMEIINFSKTTANDNSVYHFGELESGIIDKNLGQEIDFYYQQEVSQGFEVEAHVSAFKPSNDMLSTQNDHTQVMLQTKWKF